MCLGNTPQPIELAYKLFNVSKKVTILECESDWAMALAHICAKIVVVCKNPVAIDIKNMVSLYIAVILK